MPFLLALLFFAQPVIRVHFVNRTRVEMWMTIDGHQGCKAQAWSDCYATTSYKSHHLGVWFNGRELIGRESPVKPEVVFAVCHTDDTYPLCKAPKP